MNADKTSVFIGVYRRSSAAIHVLAFFSNLARWRVILLRLLTLGALIGAPTGCPLGLEGLPPIAQHHTLTDLVLCWLVILRIILAVVTVVVVSVAHILVHLIQRYPDHIRFQALQAAQYACDSVAVGLPGEGNYHHPIHNRGHLEGLGETEQRRRPP